jgi:hypothetical protein
MILRLLHFSKTRNLVQEFLSENQKSNKTKPAPRTEPGRAGKSAVPFIGVYRRYSESAIFPIGENRFFLIENRAKTVAFRVISRKKQPIYPIGEVKNTILRAVCLLATIFHSIRHGIGSPLTATGIGAVDHIFPVTFPFLAPYKGAFANGADLCRKIMRIPKPWGFTQPAT